MLFIETSTTQIHRDINSFFGLSTEDTARIMQYVCYGQVSVMENLIKWTLTRWHHYNLLRLLVGTAMKWYKATVNKTIPWNYH